MFIVSKDSILESGSNDVEPDVYMRYADLKMLAQEENARSLLIKELNKSTVLVELYKEEDGEYFTCRTPTVVDPVLPLRGVGYYEKKDNVV